MLSLISPKTNGKINFKYATEYIKHSLINPDFIYLDGPSLDLDKGKINNFTVKHQDMMPMALIF